MQLKIGQLSPLKISPPNFEKTPPYVFDFVNKMPFTNCLAITWFCLLSEFLTK